VRKLARSRLVLCAAGLPETVRRAPVAPGWRRAPVCAFRRCARRAMASRRQATGERVPVAAIVVASSAECFAQPHLAVSALRCCQHGDGRGPAFGTLDRAPGWAPPASVIKRSTPTTPPHVGEGSPFVDHLARSMDGPYWDRGL
jgi:hypothetical protein